MKKQTQKHAFSSRELTNFFSLLQNERQQKVLFWLLGRPTATTVELEEFLQKDNVKRFNQYLSGKPVHFGVVMVVERLDRNVKRYALNPKYVEVLSYLSGLVQ